MGGYKVLYIDESQDDIDDFYDYFDAKDTSEKFSVESFFPKPTLDEMIEEILDQKSDAIVVDFKLNDLKSSINYNVPYTGVQLVEKILEIKKDFPCFVITSFDNDAIKASKDVKLVYFKGIMHGDEEKTEAKANFIDKIENQILHYRQAIESAIVEVNQLEEKAKMEKLNAVDEARIVELDTFLEATFHQQNMVPRQLKSYDNLEKLHKLIESTDELLKNLMIHDEPNHA